MKKRITKLCAVGVAVIFTIMFTGMAGQVLAAGSDSESSALERPSGESQSMETQSDTQSGTQAMEQSQSMSQDVTRADKLIGQKAKDSQGNDLGEIKDLVIDQNGQVSYLVLSHGGVAGIGGDLVPIPYSQASVSMQEDEITLGNVDQAKLQNAPSFTEDEWQKLSESGFEQEVRGYFGSESGTTTTPGSESLEQPGSTQTPGSSEMEDPGTTSTPPSSGMDDMGGTGATGSGTSGMGGSSGAGGTGGTGGGM